jgi:hypothetical protein
MACNTDPVVSERQLEGRKGGHQNKYSVVEYDASLVECLFSQVGLVVGSLGPPHGRTLPLGMNDWMRGSEFEH